MKYVLIAAVSGRALADCARRAGYLPLVADLFADLDTRQIAVACEQVPGSLKRGLMADALLPALERLAGGRNPMGLVVGPGFEDRPNLLQEIAARYHLLGNTPETVTRLKDPFQFARLCRDADVPHPPVQRDRPNEGDWLCKRDGGSGGVHIVAARHAPPRPGRYYQRRSAGTAVSAAFLAAGGAIRVLGFSQQWVAPVLRRRFRYGGASRPAPLDPQWAAQLTAAIARLAALIPLCGLNSADFLVREQGYDLLEINPRPGATLDIFADPAGALFQMHLDACGGVLSSARHELTPAAAAAFVYAPTDLVVPAAFTWPAWTADRSPPGTFITRTDPICTVTAEAADVASAEKLLRERSDQIVRSLIAPPRPSAGQGTDASTLH